MPTCITLQNIFFPFNLILCWIFFQVIKLFDSLASSEISFLLSHLLFWLRNNVLLFGEGHLTVAGRSCINLARSSARMAAPLGTLFTGQTVDIHNLQVLHYSAFLSTCNKNLCSFGLLTLCPILLLGLCTCTNHHLNDGIAYAFSWMWRGMDISNTHESKEGL